MKKIYKKHCFMFIILVFFIFSHKVNANLKITEINNPDIKANQCWIKVYNDDSNQVNLTEWFVMDDDGIIPPKPWHYHTINADGSSILASNSYAIIADSSASTIAAFKSKNPNITIPLFYGSLTFKDEGNMGLSKDKKTIIGQLYYSGNSASLPDDSSDDNLSDSSSFSDSVQDSIPVDSGKIYKIETNIISPKIATAGVPFIIDHQTYGDKKEKVIIGRFVWNFGDGMKKESNVSDPFPYIYQYPGDYVLTLSFYDSSFDTTPDATDRVIVKVISSGIVISSVGTAVDPYIEIENNSNYEMSLRDWILKGVNHSFIIPEGMAILPNKKLKLSPKITGFDFSDLSNISIMDSSGQVFASYPKRITSSYENTQRKNISTGIIKADIVKNDEFDNSSGVINLNDLGANSLDLNKTEIFNKTFYIWFALIFVIILGIFSILLIRKKDDYKDYVNYELSAKDMTIIE